MGRINQEGPRYRKTPHTLAELPRMIAYSFEALDMANRTRDPMRSYALPLNPLDLPRESIELPENSDQ